MLKKYWIKCPICNGKTRVQVFHNTVLKDFPQMCIRDRLYGKRGHFACWDSPKPLKIEKGRDETICRILHTTMTNWKPPKPCG